jgi:hypothetical protein
MNAKLEIPRLYIVGNTLKISIRMSKLGDSPSLLDTTQRWLERLRRLLGESPSKQQETKSKLLTSSGKQDKTPSLL